MKYSILINYNILNYNILRYIKFICIKIKYIFYVYFTSLPQTLYRKANQHGNLSITGIGLGLIYSQQMFWVSNMGMCIFLYNKNNVYSNLNIYFYYINHFLFYACCYLYLLSLTKTIRLTKFFNLMKVDFILR